VATTLSSMLTIATATRTRAPGLPEPGTWALEPSSARVSFSGRVHRLAPMMRAAFTAVTGALHIAQVVTQSRVEVDVDARSLSTGNPAYDEMLRRLDPLDTDSHPWARYEGRLAQWDDVVQCGVISGILTLRGVQRPVELSVLSAGGASLTPGHGRPGHHGSGDGGSGHGGEGPHGRRYRASGQVDWREFGIAVDLPGYALLVPKRMTLEIDITAVLFV
jgi:polyisoprenoid-binding protein YceI